MAGLSVKLLLIGPTALLHKYCYLLSLIFVFTRQIVDKQQKISCIQVFILHLKCQDKSLPDAGFLARKHQETFGGRALPGPAGGA